MQFLHFGKRKRTSSTFKYSTYRPATYRLDESRSSAAPVRLFRSLLVACLIFATGILIVSFALRRDSHASITAPQAGEAREPSAPPKPNKKSTVAMAERINGIVSNYPLLNIGVTCIDLVHGEILNLGEQAPYVAASTSKLLTASYFLHRVEESHASLDEIVGGLEAREQLRLLIEESDQAAWVAFNDLLGRANIQSFAAAHGMPDYNAELNTLPPNNIAIFLRELYMRRVLNEDHSRLLLSHMQQAGESQYIPAAISENATVYHKAGYLKDRAHDVAIIDDGVYPYVLVIFTKAPADYNFTQGVQIFHDITFATTAAFLSAQ